MCYIADFVIVIYLSDHLFVWFGLWADGQFVWLFVCLIWLIGWWSICLFICLSDLADRLMAYLSDLADGLMVYLSDYLFVWFGWWANGLFVYVSVSLFPPLSIVSLGEQFVLVFLFEQRRDSFIYSWMLRQPLCKIVVRIHVFW